MDREPRIGDEEARDLWRHAVELQMAAEREPGARRALKEGEATGLSLAQVSEVARGAGIDPEFVVLALAERRLPDSEAIRRDRTAVRWMNRLGGADVFQAVRVLDAPPAVVLDAFRAVAATPAFHMEHEATLGHDPVQDAVLVYRIESIAASSFHSEMDLADARVILVTMRPEGNGTRLRLRIPRFRRGLNLTIAGVCTGVLGAGGSFGGAAAGGAIAALLGTASLAVVAAPAVLGALVGGSAGLAGYRQLDRWVFRSGEKSLNRLLRAVAVEAGC